MIRIKITKYFFTMALFGIITMRSVAQAAQRAAVSSLSLQAESEEKGDNKRLGLPAGSEHKAVTGAQEQQEEQECDVCTDAIATIKLSCGHSAICNRCLVQTSECNNAQSKKCTRCQKPFCANDYKLIRHVKYMLNKHKIRARHVFQTIKRRCKKRKELKQASQSFLDNILSRMTPEQIDKFHALVNKKTMSMQEILAAILFENSGTEHKEVQQS